MKVLGTELRRAIISGKFLGTCICFAFFNIFMSIPYYQEVLGGMVGYDTGPVFLQISYNVMYCDLFVYLIPILCVVPYATGVAVELKSHFVRLYLHRSGKKKYCLAKAAANVLSAGAVAVFSVLVVTILYVFVSPYKNRLEPEPVVMLWVTFLLILLLVFINAAIWSLVGAIVSTASTNPQAGYLFPFILFYVAVSFQGRYYDRLHFLNPREWIIPKAILLSQALVIGSALLAGVFCLYTVILYRRLRDA